MKATRFGLALVAVVTWWGDAAHASATDVDPELMAAIRKVKPADYPSANTVSVLDDESMVYQSDGQFTSTTHFAELVLTPAGKTMRSSMPLNYARDAETMELLSARVIKANGSVAPLGPSAIKDTEQSSYENIYDPNGRLLQVSFEGLEVGDAIDLTYRLTRRLPTRPGFFASRFVLQSDEPVLQQSYTIDGPAALPLTTTIYRRDRGARIVESQEKRGDRIRYHWAVRDQPQIIPEPRMDFVRDIPTVVVTTDPSWEHFSAWWSKETEPQMAVGPELARQVASVIKGATSDQQKINALYQFVSSDVRYRGLGVGPRTGYIPRKAEETFLSRWGVCRDVAILLTAMLRQAGFSAYPVLTAVGSPVLGKIAYEGFNHAIVAMPVPGGGWTFLDPTAKNSLDLLPGYEHEQDVLVAMSPGQPLGRIPPTPPSANSGHVTTRSTVARDGSLTAQITVATQGVVDLALREGAATMPAEQQRQAAEQRIHRVLPDAELTRFTISDPLALRQPLTIEMEIKEPGASVAAGDYQLLRTVVTSGALGLDTMLAPSLAGLPTRKYTLDAVTTFEWVQDEVVALPAGLKARALPNDVRASNAVSAVDAHCGTAADGSFTCHRSFQIKTRFIDPKQYGDLKKVMSDVVTLGRQPVILEAE